MIRVLHVVTYMGRGGLETMLMNYYRHIDRNKIQFDFLVHRDFEADYDQEIKNLGGRIYHLPPLNPFSPSYKKKLGKFFDEHPEYQIIHVHQDCLSSVILKIAKEHGIPVRIAHSHSSSQNKNIKYPIKLFYRHFIYKYATDLFACSKAAGDWMFCGTSYNVLNNAIDTSNYVFDHKKKETVRLKLGVNENEFLVGHVGRFSPSKNHFFLLDIFAEINARVPSKLLLVGDGELREDIERKIKDLGLTDCVIMTGVRDDVPDLLQTMDVFVFPSKYEGLPVTMVEAQASGLSCLISDKVPIECKKTDLVEQISLDTAPSVWAEKIISAAKRNERKNTADEVKAAGFDIVENANWLEEYYIEQSKK